MFQTRSETTGLSNFLTLKEALAEADKDKSIWKISFTVWTERVRLVRDGNNWIYKSIYEN